MVRISGKTTSIDYMLDHSEELFIYTGNYINDCKHLFRIVDDDLDDVTFQRVTQSQHMWKVCKKQYMNFVSASKYSNSELKEILNVPSYDYTIGINTAKEPKKVKHKGDTRPEYIIKDVTEARENLTECNSTTATKSNNKGKIMKALDKVKNNNLAAAKSAATLEVGKVLNKTLVSKIRPQLPMMVRGYAEHAFAEVVVANIASFAVANFASNNEKAVLATDAMMQAAMTEFVSSFNIETLIADLLDGIELPEVED